MSDPSSLEKLLTEQVNPASAAIDTLATADILRVMNAEDRLVAGAVAAVIPAISRAVDAIVAAMENGGRLFYIGTGTSGRLGVIDAAECPPTFNAPGGLVQAIIAGGEAAVARATEASEDDPAAGARDLAARGFTAADVLVAIAASGRTPYVLGAVAEANKIGALTAGISCTPASELSSQVAIAIEPLPGPELVAGSTRLKAGTATKLVLNMLTTATFIRRGYVFGNLMVNVQPTNSKLAARARRIVAKATETSLAEADELLREAGSVRAAIVMRLAGVTRAEAERLLAEAGGRVSAALQKAGHGQVHH
jgi:N-acetylmuramic acid 6-phosphate etherase